MDSDEFEDEDEKAAVYQVMREFMTGQISGSSARPGRNSRNTRRGGRGGGRGAGRTSTASGGQPVPGWEAIEQYTVSGQQLFSGKCSSCGQQCTVPFRPIQGRSPPCCKSCHAGNKQQSGTGHAAGMVGGAQPGTAAAAAAAADAQPRQAAPAAVGDAQPSQVAATAVDDAQPSQAAAAGVDA